MFEELDDFLEYINVVVEENPQRVPKRYIRDAENSLEFFNVEEFRIRYRFRKKTVVDTILPLVFDRLQKPDNRGLPIPPIIQLLICLRFYATSNSQVGSGDLRGITQPSVSGIVKKVSERGLDFRRHFIETHFGLDYFIVRYNQV